MVICTLYIPHDYQEARVELSTFEETEGPASVLLESKDNNHDEVQSPCQTYSNATLDVVSAQERSNQRN